MTWFVDTSAFYAALDRAGSEHLPATALWQRAAEERPGLVTTNYVVVETTALLQRRLGTASVRAFTEGGLRVVHVEWVSRDDHAAALSALLAAGRRGLSLVDCTSFEVMRRLGVRRAFAFDPDFEAQGFEVVGGKPPERGEEGE